MKTITVSKNKIIVFFLLIISLLSSCKTFQLSSAKAQSPNIILILADDQGWSQSSVMMDPRVPESKSDYLETPNLKNFAMEGMRFTSGYSPAPLCTPTRRSILCGTSSARSGEEFISDWVPAEHSTIPRMLNRSIPLIRLHTLASGART